MDDARKTDRQSVTKQEALAQCVRHLEYCAPEDRDAITRALRALYKRGAGVVLRGASESA